VIHAATRLSDGSFELFVWMCLHAKSTPAAFTARNADLARALCKSEREIRDSIDELERGGVCRSTIDGTEIRDRYWPCQPAGSQPVANDSEAGVPPFAGSFSVTTASRQLAAGIGTAQVIALPSPDGVRLCLALGVLRFETRVHLINGRVSTLRTDAL
jgi:hypothetical protein